MANEPKPVSESDLTEALGAMGRLLAGDSVQHNPDNPLLSSILASFEDDALKGYRRGREYTEAELRALPIGATIWVLYCKDDNPDNERFNGAYRITAMDTDEFQVHTGEDWDFDGDTSRGQAHYFVAEKATRAKKPRKTVTFQATKRWIDRPLRVCRWLHHCAVCDKDITSGQSYFDGGYGKRAHESCVDVEAEKAARAQEQEALGTIVKALR